MPTTVVNWNVAWARPDTPRAGVLRRRIADVEPDVVCITEGYTEFFSTDGHVITSGADYGYRAPKGRRKVLLWSRRPWTDIDDVGSVTLPDGRFVAGTTATDAGPIRFMAVCVPSRDAHVRTGRRNREPWADHMTYLRGLMDILGRRPLRDTVLLGDFNQTLPRTRARDDAWRY